MVAIKARVLPASMRRITEGMRAKPRQMTVALRDELKNWGEDWKDAVQDRFGSDATLRSRSGQLKGSISTAVSGNTLGTLKLRNVSAGVNYARQREHGGVIKPKNSKFLAIPTEANKKATGVTDLPSAREFIDAHPGQTFFAPSKSGGLVLFWIKPEAKFAKRGRTSGDTIKFKLGGTKSQAVAMFYLVREVDQPGPKSVKHPGPSKLGFHDEWKARINDRGRGLQRIARAVAKAGSGG